MDEDVVVDAAKHDDHQRVELTQKLNICSRKRQPTGGCAQSEWHETESECGCMSETGRCKGESECTCMCETGRGGIKESEYAGMHEMWAGGWAGGCVSSVWVRE